MGDTDSFVLAMERAMERSGQGIHLSQSVLELESCPDLEAMRQAMRLMVERHPVITWEGRYTVPGVPPRLYPSSRPAEAVPLHFWLEKDAPEEALKGVEPGNVSTTPSLDDLLSDRLSLSKAEFHQRGHINLWCDLVARRDGSYALVFTWRHLLFDGVGAELLACEMASLASSKGESYVTSGVGEIIPPGGPDVPFHERWRQTYPMVKRFYELMAKPFKSLSGPRPTAGRICFKIVPLSVEDTERINARAAELCGPLITTPYFLACATLAHHRVWEHRQTVPENYLVSLPVQLRKPGAKGPLFQNKLSMIFFSADREMAEDVPAMCTEFAEQHRRVLKERLGDSFRQLQFLMRRMPPRMYVWFLLRQMRGEFNSFYHSNTGEFAPNLTEFYGAPVTNAYHVPTITNPPGSGLFVNTKNGCMTAAMTWRDGVIDEEEQKILMDSFLSALKGEP